MMIYIGHNTLGKLSWALLVIFLFFFNCVPGVSILGAPCPCPEGYECCETTSACIEEGGSCPDNYPESSEGKCEADTDCSPNELCHSWSTSEDATLGPGECRRVCNPPTPCSDEEVCALALHDSALMNELNADYMCLPETPTPGCEDHICSVCSDEELGTVWCDDDAIFGCFFVLNPACGLGCFRNMMSDCGEFECIESEEGVPECDAVDSPPWEGFDCNECPSYAPPGEAGCDGNQIITCWIIPDFNEADEDLCYLINEPCPDDWTCDDENGPVCVPKKKK